MGVEQRPSSAATAASTIRVDAPGMTLINVFTVDAERQQELVEMLERATVEVFQYLPGFRSVNVHRSLDGTKVVNYVQWESRELFEATGRDPAAQAQRDAIAAVASFEFALYEVTAVHVARELIESES
jgi:heme-degrading monooxygenase HmoA